MTKLPESVHEPSENLRLVEINTGPKLVLKNRFLGHFERVLFLTGKQLWSMGAKANLSNPFTLGLFSYRDTGHSVTAIQTHEKRAQHVFFVQICLAGYMYNSATMIHQVSQAGGELNLPTLHFSSHDNSNRIQEPTLVVGKSLVRIRSAKSWLRLSFFKSPAGIARIGIGNSPHPGPNSAPWAAATSFAGQAFLSAMAMKCEERGCYTFFWPQNGHS